MKKQILHDRYLCKKPPVYLMHVYLWIFSQLSIKKWVKYIECRTCIIAAWIHRINSYFFHTIMWRLPWPVSTATWKSEVSRTSPKSWCPQCAVSINQEIIPHSRQESFYASYFQKLMKFSQNETDDINEWWYYCL